MKTEAEALRQNYELMETEELMDRYERGSLTDVANSVLRQVLRERGVADAKIVELSLGKDGAQTSTDPELASLSERLFARAIDFLVYGVIFIVGAPLNKALGSTSTGLILIFLIYLFYLLLADALPNGQSIGKKVLNISVVSKEAHLPCTPLRSIARNLCFLTSFVDWLFIFGRDRQRLGDKIAGSIVVRKARPSARGVL